MCGSKGLFKLTNPSWTGKEVTERDRERRREERRKRKGWKGVQFKLATGNLLIIRSFLVKAPQAKIKAHTTY